jgi:hypothetical protein
MFGWKESSYSPNQGSIANINDPLWRIHFVCDLNTQNIQNWLFTPLIPVKLANRVTLNLTFTIRECEQFPIEQVVKNCREKFELYYYEEDGRSDDDSSKRTNENDTKSNQIYLLNKIKQLRFRDTFVSDTALRYYNSAVDRQRMGDQHSIINMELREIPLNMNKKNGASIRFAIRDTGACISLLAVEVSYITCPLFQKYGITFAETSTGRDLTDLIQVSGKCPLYTANSQTPSAICTAKGEWLITDPNLENRCLCLPGYEFILDHCSRKFVLKIQFFYF